MTGHGEGGGMDKTPTYGVELEKTFSGRDGAPHAVGEQYFDALVRIKSARGESPQKKDIGGRTVEVTKGVDGRPEGLDANFFLGESATGPVSEDAGGLTRLDAITREELRDVDDALAGEGATIINMSNHPLIPVTDEVYRGNVIPKPYYDFLNHQRGWTHKAGIDAASQNSPSTGVEVGNAVDAVNTMFAAGPALIALYANSPFKEGAVAGLKESRLTIWNTMFANAPAGDRKLCKMPEKPFANMRSYFEWMFGPDTEMLFALDSGGPAGAKAASRMVQIDGKPSILEFLSKPTWQGTVFGSGEKVNVVPDMGHFEMHQYMQFAGARIRFALEENQISPQEFIAAMKGKGDEVETLLAGHAKYFYIEGRDPGANFPDKPMRDLPNGELLARSVVISPSAIQAGLIRNQKGMQRVLQKYRWSDLRGLRDASIKDGLQGEYNGIKVKEYTDDIMDVAVAGLSPEEQWMLFYPAFVLSSEMNGADRALKHFEGLSSGSVTERIQAVLRSRALSLP